METNQGEGGGEFSHDGAPNGETGGDHSSRVCPFWKKFSAIFINFFLELVSLWSIGLVDLDTVFKQKNVELLPRLHFLLDMAVSCSVVLGVEEYVNSKIYIP